MPTAEPTSGVIGSGYRSVITPPLWVRGLAAHVGLQGLSAFETMLPIAVAPVEQRRVIEKRATCSMIRPQRARQSVLRRMKRCEAGEDFDRSSDRRSNTVDPSDPAADPVEERRELSRAIGRFRGSDTGFISSPAGWRFLAAGVPMRGRSPRSAARASATHRRPATGSSDSCPPGSNLACD